ncbi:MAG: histone H1 [Gemmatimonadota bacterium]
MPKRRTTPARPTDVNELARRIVAISTGEESDESPTVDQKAVKRGEARSAKLTPEERKAIAKKAADARWHDKG